MGSIFGDSGPDSSSEGRSPFVAIMAVLGEVRTGCYRLSTTVEVWSEQYQVAKPTIRQYLDDNSTYRRCLLARSGSTQKIIIVYHSKLCMPHSPIPSQANLIPLKNLAMHTGRYRLVNIDASEPEEHLRSLQMLALSSILLKYSMGTSEEVVGISWGPISWPRCLLTHLIQGRVDGTRAGLIQIQALACTSSQTSILKTFRVHEVNHNVLPSLACQRAYSLSVCNAHHCTDSPLMPPCAIKRNRMPFED